MNFITHSKLSGTMPSALSGTTYFTRNALLAVMMRNRQKVRYIVGPYGFGKSLLAASYADLVNRLEHTFWLDGENPCFLRDLDARTLLHDLLDVSDVGDLVVFDDVAHLGATRRGHVWKTCATLVREGREVVVCATPSADPLRGHEKECICLSAQDLLYSEKDGDALRVSGVRMRQDVPALHPVSRVPSLAACDKQNFCDFLRAHIEEMDDPAQSALSFVLLVLERGSFEDAEVVLGGEITAADIDAQRLRAFMQVDAYSGEFAALGFPLKEVFRAFAPYMPAIARETGMDDASELAVQLADMLLERGNAKRAGQLMIALCDPHGRSTWLAQRQDAMLNACALASAEQLYDSLRSERWRSRPVLMAASALRRALIDCADASLDDLTGLAAKVDFPLEQRLLCASVAYVLTEDAQQAAELEVLFHGQKTGLKRESEQLDGSAQNTWVFWSKTAAGTTKVDNIAAKLDSAHDIFLPLACCAHKARLDGCAPEELPNLTRMVAVALGGASGDYGTAYLYLLRREVDALGLDFDTSQMPVLATYRRLDTFADELEVQRTLYAQNKVSQFGALSSMVRSQLAKQGLRTTALSREIPLLDVRLFGQFDVRLGNTPIEYGEFKRQKVRTLLALLVLESGHELSCDNLAERLWPDSTDLQARHNFYNCVSILRKGISLADGSCPYLLRPHGIISVDARLVKSDVAAMKEVCNHLRFVDPDPNVYAHALEQVRELYPGELLPSETDESMIIAAREEWRNRIVNSLLHAGQRLASVGDTTVALALAEQALIYNPQREDCYEHLMSLQARCGQRPAAIETWMRYRTFLKDDLGLDPSQRVSKLYDRIINETM